MVWKLGNNEMVVGFVVLFFKHHYAIFIIAIIIRLNEGFATYIGYQAIAEFFPEWNFWAQFVLQQTEKVISHIFLSCCSLLLLFF